MLTKDLLRVSRRGSGYHPGFVGDDDRDLAARVTGVYQGHVGRPREELDEALENLEREASDFKLVRGFAKLLERDAAFATRAPVTPERARRVTFETAEEVGVVAAEERSRTLERAAERLDASPGAVERSLYADLPDRQVLARFDPRWDPDELLDQYNLSLAQTALFDAVELRARSSDPRKLVTATKRLGLLYEIERADPGEGPGTRAVVVTGPDALFRRTRRYGTRFARLLRTLAGTDRWQVTATVDDRGTERTLELSDADPVRLPGVDPVTDVEFDSGVEADFAARFEALGLDWTLHREPDPLEAGEGAMIPDFAFEYDHADFQVYFEIMGFWTPEYVEKKLGQLEAVEDEELLVAVDRDLGVGEDVEARDHRVITYSGHVRVKDVRDALRTYEDDLVAESASDLSDELVPDEDVVGLAQLADRHGVPEEAVEDRTYPDHDLVGRTLVRPAVLDVLRGEIQTGMTLTEAEDRLEERGITDASAVLSELGYRVEWEGLSGGTLREK